MLRKKISENSSKKNKKLKTDNTQNDQLNLYEDNTLSTNVSKYFPNVQVNQIMMTIENKILQLQIKLNEDLRALDLIKPPISFIYNPLEYAFGPNEVYIKKYCTTPKKILFVGMNPGAFGMCQTGVPFGDPKWVREWLKVEGEVKKPQIECPDRKILGFSSQRKEQSGHRFWGLFCKLCGTPENFFKHSFVSNFCPLTFLESNGRNITPGEIKNIQDRKDLESVCESSYLNLVRLLNPEFIIPLGEYMERRTKQLCKNSDVNVQVIRMPHPSPRAVKNQNWQEKAENFLRDHNLIQYFQNDQ
ncbi:single-strand selective monofunctional uracil DNA glycosylase [Anoplophora glabripennis]|uniref:single-strand selective monofunctional uracil DNA glycosylase n=1 Tax=Anoplophora glabripennis TaxID=217634 RepID=UPI0008738FB7|nr:single-strand selective monofunctional uracil DNA glycosylase [Anoplophora glabripennis]